MPPETCTRTLSYRRCFIVGVESQADTLETLIKTALDRHPVAINRRQLVGDDGGMRLINNRINYRGMLAVNFLDFTPGVHQWVIDVDSKAHAFKLDQIPPRHEREEFLEGVLFLGVLGDHVVLVMSKALRSASIEEYLNWLFVEHTNLLPPTGRVILNPEKPNANALLAKGVKSVRLATTTQAPKFDASNAQTTHGLAGEVLLHAREALAKAKAELSGVLSADKALKVEDFQLTFEITRKSRSRKPNGTVLDDIAELVRHADDVSFDIRSKAGKLSSDDLKLTVSRKVLATNRTPVLSDVAKVMHEWLQQLLQDKRVRS